MKIKSDEFSAPVYFRRCLRCERAFVTGDISKFICTKKIRPGVASRTCKDELQESLPVSIVFRGEEAVDVDVRGGARDAEDDTAETMLAETSRGTGRPRAPRAPVPMQWSHFKRNDREAS